MIGKRIKKVRNDMELSQTEFGARMGYSRDIIGNTEAERVEMKPYLIKSICSVYNVNEQWLLTGEGDMYTLPKEEIALNEILANATINDGSKIKEIVSGLSLLDEKYVDAIITLSNGLNNQKK